MSKKRAGNRHTEKQTERRQAQETRIMKIGILGTGMVGNAIGTKLVETGHQTMMGFAHRRQ